MFLFVFEKPKNPWCIRSRRHLERMIPNKSNSYGRKSLIQRHKGKFVMSIAAITALFATGSICIFLVKRWLYQQQLKITEQHFIREQIRRRFTQTQQDSLYALYELIPVFTLVLVKDFDLEQFVIVLRDKKLSKTNTATNNKAHDADAANLSSVHGGLTSSIIGTETVRSDVVVVPNVRVNEKVNLLSKAQLWNELKIKSIIKMITISYTVSSLLLLTRLQLNILTRREYVDTAVKVAIEQEDARPNIRNTVFHLFTSWITPAINSNSDNITSEAGNIETKKSGAISKSKIEYINEQAFLSLSWWLLNRGWLEFSSAVEEQVYNEFNDLNPKDTLSLKEFSEKLTNIFHTVNQKVLVNIKADSEAADNIKLDSSPNALNTILLPDVALREFVLKQTMDPETLKVLQQDNSVLDQLLDETTQYLNGTTSMYVLESLINESFQFIMSNLEHSVSKKKKLNRDDEQSEIKIEDKKFQLALIAMSCKDCCQDMLKSGTAALDNDFLQRLDSMNTLDDISASVYSNFEF